VIVLDGMSVAVFQELLSDMPSHEWQLLAPSDTGLLPGLATAEPWPEGFSEVAIDKPDWWTVAPESSLDEMPELKSVQRKAVGRLFDPDEDEAKLAAAKTGPAPLAATWIDLLLSSPAFAMQKQVAGRAVPSDADFRKILQSIEDRKGKVTSVALARTIEITPSRLRTMFSVIQRVLNSESSVSTAMPSFAAMNHQTALNLIGICSLSNLG